MQNDRDKCAIARQSNPMATEVLNSNSYYLLEQDLRIPETSAIGSIPNNLEPLDWLSGKVQPDPGSLKLSLSAASGDFLPDMMGSLVTLFSTGLKNALAEFGVQNIQYFPVGK